MIGLRVNQAKSLFFDRSAVMSRTTIAERKNLSRFGAYCRRNAKSSIGPRRKISAPGQPPSSHTGLLKQFIFFVYEPERKNVIIGPARLNKIGNAPEALEYGGPSAATVLENGQRTLKSILIRPRPYMRPAFEKTKLEIPGIWRDSIK